MILVKANVKNAMNYMKAHDRRSCSECALNFIFDVASKTCVDCYPGFEPAENGISCNPCEAGKYSLNGLCTDCPEGKSSEKASPDVNGCVVYCEPGQEEIMEYVLIVLSIHIPRDYFHHV